MRGRPRGRGAGVGAVEGMFARGGRIWCGNVISGRSQAAALRDSRLYTGTGMARDRTHAEINSGKWGEAHGINPGKGAE